jgi:hypothetical protein
MASSESRSGARRGAGRKPRYSLMVGVLASGKTLHGGQGKWPGRYPRVRNDRRNIFVSDSRCGQLDPLCDGRSREPCRTSSIRWLRNRRATHLHGIPAEHQLAESRAIWNSCRQAEPCASFCRSAAKRLNSRSRSLGFPRAARRLRRPHHRRADRSKRRRRDQPFDNEHGAHAPVDHPRVLSETRFRDRRRAFAGNGRRDIAPLLSGFPGLSIDAEGRLRTPQPEDKLDLDRAKQYVARAFQIMA